MRRILLTSLALLPVMAYAQAPNSAAKSAYAELAVPALPAAAIVTANHPSEREAHIVVSDRVQVKTDEVDFASTKAFDPIARWQSSAPRVKTAASLGDLSEELGHKSGPVAVVVDATIDANGVPRNLSVSRSAGRAIDEKALAAVSQYRFAPARLDNRATESNVSIVIKIQKP